MRTPTQFRRALFALPVLACAFALGAQEPEAGGAPPAAPAKPPEPVVAIRAGTIHPVAGAPIADGVIVIRGTRIAAIGKRSEVTIPDDAVVRDFPNAHVYPGLVDALTDAFVDNSTRNDGTLDAGSRLVDDLRPRGDREDELVQHGITTAYVGNRSNAPWRGQGVVIRPIAGGYEVFAGREQAGLQVRAQYGPGPSHPLQRQQMVQGVFTAFDGLTDYRKQFEEHKKALEKYTKDFADYLAHFEKKNAPAGGAPPAPSGPAAPTPGPGQRGGALPAGGTGDQPPGGRRGGRRGDNGGGGNGGNSGGLVEWIEDLAQDPPKPTPAPPAQDPKAGNSQDPKPAETPKPPEGDKAPERPKYPKAPPSDPNKDALLAVLDGKLPLRVEAHRADEIRTALALAAAKKVPSVVLEQPFAAAACASDLAKAGVSCVLTEVWPSLLPKPYDSYDVTALPATLQAQGVPFAIATGSARRAAALPMMAACAVGRGLDSAAALRAITLTAAEILGVQKDTGSLEAGKLGDVLVCDRPLFASDCRVLAVLAAGKTQFEAK